MHAASFVLGVGLGLFNIALCLSMQPESSGARRATVCILADAGLILALVAAS